MADECNVTAHGAASSWPTLLSGESLQWEGRPAPRCYTFRQWRHALFGVVLTIVCGVWEVMGVQQAAEQGWRWLAWVPLPFLGYALWLAFGHPLPEGEGTSKRENGIPSPLRVRGWGEGG